MSAPRMCKVFHCDMRGDRFCCADCPKRFRCSNPCENDPSRCRLEDTDGRVKAAEIRQIRAVDLFGEEK